MRRLVILASALVVIVAGKTTPATAQDQPRANSPHLLCNQNCSNSTQCDLGDACTLCIHPQGKCG